VSAALKEWPLAASVVTTLLFLLLGQQWLADLSNPFWFALMLLWPLAAILVSAFALVRHAESVTMFVVIMIVLNGLVGLCLVLGGLRYREQTLNLYGANAFLAVIIPLAVLVLVMPTFTTHDGRRDVIAAAIRVSHLHVSRSVRHVPRTADPLALRANTSSWARTARAPAWRMRRITMVSASSARCLIT